MKAARTRKLTIWQNNAKSGFEKCAKCGETRNLTVDHIVPVFILKQFILDQAEVLENFDDNFQYLCRYCNQGKNCMLDVRNPKTYEILEKVIKEAKEYHLSKNV